LLPREEKKVEATAPEQEERRKSTRREKIERKNLARIKKRELKEKREEVNNLKKKEQTRNLYALRRRGRESFQA